MKDEELAQMVDTALLDGLIEAECLTCGMILQCEPDAESAWCDHCGRIAKIRNPIIESGLI